MLSKSLFSSYILKMVKECVPEVVGIGSKRRFFCSTFAFYKSFSVLKDDTQLLYLSGSKVAFSSSVRNNCTESTSKVL